MSQQTLYIKADKNVEVTKKKIILQEIVDIYGVDKAIIRDLNSQVVYLVEDSKNEVKYVVSILDIIKLIIKKYPDIDVNNVGEMDFLVSYRPKSKKNKIIEYIKVGFVILTVFFGSAFAMMSFNTDGEVRETFTMIYKLFMKTDATGGSILEISYAIGIPLGTIIFFNHFSKVRIDDDPTPLQIQMRMYEENAYKTIIENSNRDKQNKM